MLDCELIMADGSDANDNGTTPEKKGYGHPPKKHRFKKGDPSPNPGGRRSKRSCNTDESFIAFMEKIVAGQSIYKRVQQGIVKAGIQGNVRAGMYLLEKYEKAKKQQKTTANADEEGLEAIQRLLRDNPALWQEILDPKHDEDPDKQ